MDYTIRKIKETEYPLLKDFLYEAIFVPEGVELNVTETVLALLCGVAAWWVNRNLERAKT